MTFRKRALPAAGAAVAALTFASFADAQDITHTDPGLGTFGNGPISSGSNSIPGAPLTFNIIDFTVVYNESDPTSGSWASDLALSLDFGGTSIFIAGGGFGGAGDLGSDTDHTWSFDGSGSDLSGTYTSQFFLPGPVTASSYNWQAQDTFSDTAQTWQISLAFSSGSEPTFAGTEVGSFSGPGAVLGTNDGGTNLSFNTGGGSGDGYSGPEVTYRIDWAGGDFTAELDIFANDPSTGVENETAAFGGADDDLDMYLFNSMARVPGANTIPGEDNDIIPGGTSGNFTQPIGTDPNEFFTIEDLPAGTYYLVIDGWDGSIADFELRVIPEPASLALIGLAGLGLLRRRRA